MMISAHTIGMTSSRIPQPAGICAMSLVSVSPLRRRGGLKWSSGFPKGRGHSNLAINCKQASSFSSSAADASDNGIPAMDADVRHFTAGTKNVELMDPIQEANRASALDDQLPSLLSLFIDGLPALQPSKYAREARECLLRYVQRYPNAKSLKSYCSLGLSSVICLYPRVLNVDRFVAMAVFYGLMFMVDDVLFDTPDESLDNQYGITSDARESPQKIQEYLDRLNAIFSQQVLPSNPAPLIETLLWECGRDISELSDPEWFTSFVAGIREFFGSSVTSHEDIVQGKNFSFHNLESYTMMRIGNVAATFVQLLAEFATHTYIPSLLKVTPYFKIVTMATSTYIGYINDIFSYHKESTLEDNPRNLITVLMECERKPFVQAVHRAIGLVNSYARIVMDLEAVASSPILQSHLHDMKVLIAGNLYFNFSHKRYQQPNSIFPELRDTTSSWEILPHIKSLEL